MGTDVQPPPIGCPTRAWPLCSGRAEHITLRANLGRYGRLPSMIERYGNTGQLLGNPDLVPETGTNADVGANWTRVGERLRLRLDGALFAAWARDLITFRQVGSYMRPGNLGRARILGGKPRSRSTGGAASASFGQTTFTDARDEEDVSGSTGKQLPKPAAPARLRAPRAARSPLVRALALGAIRRPGCDQRQLPRLGQPGRGQPACAVRRGRPDSASPTGGCAWPPARTTWPTRLSSTSPAYPLPGRSIFLTLQWSKPDPNKETLE